MANQIYLVNPKKEQYVTKLFQNDLSNFTEIQVLLLHSYSRIDDWNQLLFIDLFVCNL